MNHFVYPMPLGRLTIAAHEKGIVSIHFGDVELDMPRKPSTLTNKAATQIQEYFAGKRREFDLPLDPKGTDFQLTVWKALQTVPYGETRTYAQIAEAIGKPHAYRAVGMANNKNPIPILIPCHRVVGADGSLTGYAGGIDKKLWLLDHEGVETDRFFVPDNSTAP